MSRQSKYNSNNNKNYQSNCPEKSSQYAPDSGRGLSYPETLQETKKS